MRGPEQSGEITDDDAKIASIHWTVPIGRKMADGKYAGALTLFQEDLTSTSFTMAGLNFASFSGAVEERGSKMGPQWQIRTPDVLVDLQPNGSGGYNIKGYNASDVTWDPGTGFYTINVGAQPLVTYSVENAGTGYSQLRIVKNLAGTITKRLFTHNLAGATRTWTMTENPDGPKKRITTKTITTYTDPTNGSMKDETTTLTDQDGAIASKVVDRYKFKTWPPASNWPIEPQKMKLEHWELVKVVSGVETYQKTLYTYYDQDADSVHSQGLVKTIRYPDGYWERFNYKIAGLLEDSTGATWHDEVFSPWGDDPYTTPDTATASNSRRVAKTWRTSGSLDGKPLLVTQVESLPQSLNLPVIRTLSRQAYQIIAAPENLLLVRTNDVYYRETESSDGFERTVTFSYGGDSSSPRAGQLKRVRYPDGRFDEYSYEVGTIFNTSTFDVDNPTSNPTVSPATKYFLVEMVDHNYWTDPDPLVSSISDPARSTRLERITDNAGRLRVEREYVFAASAGASEPIRETRYVYDSRNRLTDLLDRNGRVIKHIDYSNGLKSSEFDEDGTQTTYTYDGLNRVATSTKKGVTLAGSYPAQADIVTTFTYDAADRVTSTVVTSGSLSQTTSTIYDQLGRVISRTEPSGLSTTTLYEGDENFSDGLPTKTTITRPDGKTEITELYRDRRLKSVTGTGVEARYSSYAFVPEPIPGSSPVVYFRTLSRTDYVGVNLGARYINTVEDWKGRPFRITRPAFGSGEVTLSEKTFSSAGLLTRETRSGYAPRLFAYDSFGRPSYEVLDVNGNGNIDATGTDRITQVSRQFEYQPTGSQWYEVQTVLRWEDTSSSTPVTVSERRQQLSGLAATRKSRVLVKDALDNQTEQTVDVDRTAKIVTMQSKRPSTTLYSTTLVRNGLVVSSTVDTFTQARTYFYDGLGRRTAIQEPNGAISTTVFNTLGQVDYVYDHLKQTNRYAYFGNGLTGAGRVSVQTLPDGTTKRLEYDGLGRVRHEWGSATYPVEYEYDPVYNELIKLRTYRGGNSVWNQTTWGGASETPDLTQWVIQEKTGLLLEKKDALLRKTAYTYLDTADFRLSTRSWARIYSGSTPVTTTYGYDPNTGELTSTSYNDGTTSVVRGYDRVGRLVSVQDAAGTRTLTYFDSLNQPLTETFATLPFNGIILNHTYDSFGRPQTVSSTSTPQLWDPVSYAYKSEGRLDKVTSGKMRWTYSYESGSDRLGQVLSEEDTATSGGPTYQSRMIQPRKYDLLGRLQSIENQIVGAATGGKLAYGYQYDSLNRRRQSVLADGTSWSYVYDDKGQVVSGKRYWPGIIPVGGQQFEYEYDSIGNRTAARRGGDATGGGLRPETYSMDPATIPANQYKSRTLSDSIDIVGLSYASGTVTVSGSAAARQGEYFYKATVVGDTAAPKADTVSVSSSGGGVLSPSGTVYSPPRTQNFGYDLDGNLTSDGLWVYEWNGENQLKSMYMSGFADTTTTRYRLDFTYDYLGRRIRKTVSTWINDTGAWSSPTSDTIFLYEGWRLMAERRVSDGLTVRSYVWGTDLSGSWEGAGGIGGALGVRTAATGVPHLYAYDGNGNVVGLKDSATQSWSAIYEYGPFGEVIRGSGTMAKSNPIRFSTKYQDSESELLYYGYRFYSASTGRWLSRDPIQERGGKNLYGFVFSNPVNRFDKLGLFAPNRALGSVVDRCACQAAVGAQKGGMGGPLFAAVVASTAVATALVAIDVGLATEITALDKQNEEDAGKIDEKSGEYDSLKTRCNQKVPSELANPGNDIEKLCAKWRWELQRNKDCIAMQIAFSKKWYNGPDERHLGKIGDLQRGNENLEDKIKRLCKPCPEGGNSKDPN